MRRRLYGGVENQFLRGQVHGEFIADAREPRVHGRFISGLEYFAEHSLQRAVLSN